MERNWGRRGLKFLELLRMNLVLKLSTVASIAKKVAPLLFYLNQSFIPSCPSSRKAKSDSKSRLMQRLQTGKMKQNYLLTATYCFPPKTANSYIQEMVAEGNCYFSSPLTTDIGHAILLNK